MSVNLTTFRTQEYAATVELLAQQMGSRLRKAVREEAKGVGKQMAEINQLGAIDMQEVTTRFEAMPRIDNTTARRWTVPKDYDLPQQIDMYDIQKMGPIDPKNQYVQVGVASVGRRIDNTIITAFFAAATSGETGSSTTAFDTTNNQIAVNYASSGNVGLTVAKLREARRILMGGNVDLEAEPVWIAVTAQQHDDLLAEAQVTSVEFNSRPVLTDGRIAYFMGFNFIHTELLGVDSSSYRRVPVWVPSGIRLRFWNDFTSDISQRKDLRGLPWQLLSLIHI